MKAKLMGVLIGCTFATSGFATEYHVAKSGNDQNAGSRSQPFLTINRAAAVALPGDVVTVHQGTYREWIALDHGGTDDAHRITFRAAAREAVQIKGSEVIKGWRPLAKGIWKITLPNNFFGEYNPYSDLIFGDWFFPGQQKLHTGEVYLNGKAFQEAEALEHPGTWRCSATADSTSIQANFGAADPNVELVEINVRPACFYPARTHVNYITLSGFHLSQAATQWAAPTAEQIGLVGTNWSKGWIIENNVISDSKCVGLTLGKDRASGHNVWSNDMSKDGSLHYNEMILRAIAEGWNKQNIGSHLVRHNIIYNCGAAGICGSFGAAYSRVLDNEVYNIYTRRNFYGAEMAGIKFHGAIDMEISGNRVHDAFIGLWLDWMAQGTVVSKNIFYGNDYVDFFPEVNHGPYNVTGNQFLSAFSLRDWSEDGTYKNNVFAGLLSQSPQERATPVFRPHTTELVKVYPVTGGNSRFYHNVFKSGDGEKAVRPKMHATDNEDEHIGYGLGIYNDIDRTVKACGNNYLGNAQPLASEKNKQRISLGKNEN